MNSYEDSYQDAYGVKGDCPPLELLQAAVDKSVIIPDKSVQAPIMIANAMMPSSGTSILPICISYGQSGTGKSAFGKIVHGVWGLDERFLLAGKTTPTAIRNMLMIQKYGSDWFEFQDDLDDEKNAVLIWDDIDPSILSDTLILSMLKSGYSKKSANLAVANVGGSNNYYNFFSVKFTSTIHPIWSIDELRELKRRSLIFYYKHVYAKTADEMSGNPTLDDAIDLDYVSFEGYTGARTIFLDLADLERSKKLSQSLRRKLRDANFPKWYGKLCFDLIVVGTVLGAFASISDAITKLESFYSIQEKVSSEKTEFQIFMSNYIESEVSLQSQLIQVRELGFPIEIPRAKLQKAIDKAIDSKEIPRERINLRNVMKEFGFELISEKSTMKLIKELNKHVSIANLRWKCHSSNRRTTEG